MQCFWNDGTLILLPTEISWIIVFFTCQFTHRCNGLIPWGLKLVSLHQFSIRIPYFLEKVTVRKFTDTRYNLLYLKTKEVSLTFDEFATDSPTPYLNSFHWASAYSWISHFVVNRLRWDSSRWISKNPDPAKMDPTKAEGRWSHIDDVWNTLDQMGELVRIFTGNPFKSRQFPSWCHEHASSSYIFMWHLMCSVKKINQGKPTRSTSWFARGRNTLRKHEYPIHTAIFIKQSTLDRNLERCSCNPTMWCRNNFQLKTITQVQTTNDESDWWPILPLIPILTLVIGANQPCCHCTHSYVHSIF